MRDGPDSRRQTPVFISRAFGEVEELNIGLVALDG